MCEKNYKNILNTYNDEIDKLFKKYPNKYNNHYFEDRNHYDIKNFRISELIAHPSRNHCDEKGFLNELSGQLKRINGIRVSTKKFKYPGDKKIKEIINHILNYLSNYASTKQKYNINKEKYTLQLNKDNTYIITIIQNLFDDASSKIKYINQKLDLHLSTPSVEDLINDPHSKYSRLQNLKFNYLRYKRGQQGEDLVFKDTKFESCPTNKILRDINLYNDYGNSSDDSSYQNNQMDEIIINSNGIYIPEIKSYNAKKIVLKSNGHLIAHFNNGSVKDFGNIVDQLSKHENTIKKFLIDKYKDRFNGINILSFIVCANDNVDSKSFCNNTNIYYPKTFYHSLINQHLSNKTLTINNIDDICNKINKYKQADLRFDDKLVFSSYFTMKIEGLLIYIEAILKLNHIAYKKYLHSKEQQNGYNNSNYIDFGFVNNDVNSDEPSYH